MLYNAMAAILIVACFGSALNGQVSSARILFSMGRENILPREPFAHLDPQRNTTSRNFWIIGLLALGAAMVLSFEQGADVLNFGSFLAFMGVNVAAFWQFYASGQRGGARRGANQAAEPQQQSPRVLVDALPPLLGFFCCLAIWWGLPAMTKIIGGIWLLLGVIIAGVATRGFRSPPPLLAPDES